MWLQLQLFPDARKSATPIKLSQTFKYHHKQQLYSQNFKTIRDARLKDLFGDNWFLKKHKKSFAVVVKIRFALIKEIITSYETVQEYSRRNEIVPGTIRREESILIRFSGIVCYGSLWQDEPDGWEKEVNELIELHTKKKNKISFISSSPFFEQCFLS